ncbi:unnamed protein product [Soboliphyme baturini]|uniref:AA_permease_C domain-containing protein n=1 Tax=Soboliphyme baturini TaxID=241478 RepID=A0A183J2K5_9BILA|nr:unnamed protein product [Soboliphyme baturini]
MSFFFRKQFFGILKCHKIIRIRSELMVTSTFMFKVPFVPIIPVVSNFVNSVLLLHLAPATWIRLIICLIAGFLLYFGYGINHSHAEVVFIEEEKSPYSLEKKREAVASEERSAGSLGASH